MEWKKPKFLWQMNCETITLLKYKTPKVNRKQRYKLMVEICFVIKSVMQLSTMPSCLLMAKYTRSASEEYWEIIGSWWVATTDTWSNLSDLGSVCVPWNGRCIHRLLPRSSPCDPIRTSAV